MEKFEQTSQDIKEFEWVKQQVKAELQSLQQNVQQELFYQKEGDKVTYNLDLVKTYLEHIKDRSWSQLTEKNSSAWIMAVQIALEHQGYDVEKVDGLWWEATKAAIESFQGANELVKDGKPWTLTIQKLLEGMWSSTSQAETSETPTETTETPAETRGTPAETSETPTKTSGTPAETSETPTETSETPTETTETPTETTETPTEITETPTETTETPTETSETPTKTSGTPAETSETPTETSETPAETRGTPAETSETPTKTSGTPAETSGTPTKTSGTPTETTETPAETTGTPAEKPQTQTEKAGEIKEIDLSTLGAWDENRNFVFNEGVEKTDQKGKYIEIEGKKYYKYKEGMTWLGYNAFIEDDGRGKLWYWKVLNGKFYKQVFQYYSDGEIKETHWNKMENQIKQISKKADGTINWEYNYEYDEKGNTIKQTKKNADGTIDYEWNYEYDEKGNKIKQIKKKADGTIDYEYNYEYDEKGNQIKTIDKKADGTIDSEYNYEYDEKGNKIKEISKNADGTIDYEWNYEYDEKGNQIKQISKNADGTITNEYNYEYDEKGNLIKLKREGTDNNNYDIAYTRHENGNKKTEKMDDIVGITIEREYNKNKEITKEKKTYYDDKPVIEWNFKYYSGGMLDWGMRMLWEWELIKEEVENQEDEATKSSYTGQVNAYNKQKHGSGTTTFKNKQTEGGYYENGELLIWGEKSGKDLSKQRGAVKLREVYTVNKEKKKYQKRTVESWGNRITLIDTASGYTFSTRSGAGAKLTLPKTLWRKKALNAANLINAVVGIVKQSGNELDYFEADGNRLEADYKVSASNLRYGLQDATLIKNVNEKFWVSAKELAAWLNEYRKELGI